MQKGVVFFVLMLLFFKSYGSDKKKHSSTGKELQIVFCTDLSGSTNGLINDLRDNLWHIINQAHFIAPDAELKIGVVAFSRPSFKKEHSYVKVLCDLTSDFDYLASELSRIRPSIEKGDQFVGAALRTCVTEISWSDDAFKIIYIIGNGMVEDASNEYIKSCELAVKNSITVNSVYAIGKNKAKEYMGWLRIAKAGGGMCSEITIGNREAWSDFTVDYKELFDAFRDYNLTTTYYTVSGFEKYMNYRRTDSLAFTGGNAVFYERAYYKKRRFGSGYHSEWDLVDYNIKTGFLPAFNETLLLPDSLKDRNGEYIFDLVKVLKVERGRAASRLKNVLASDVPSQLHQKYVSGEFKEERNMFSRCIINILMKQYH